MDDNPYRAEHVDKSQPEVTTPRQPGFTRPIVVSTLGGLFSLAAFGWLVVIFMRTNAFGRTIPPRGFTGDRFGPPLVALLIGLAITAAGLLTIFARLDRFQGDL
jgi:hypothetical protein